MSDSRDGAGVMVSPAPITPQSDTPPVRVDAGQPSQPQVDGRRHADGRSEGQVHGNGHAHGHDHTHDHHHHDHADDAGCACGHDHGEDGGHNHSGVSLNIQLAVILPTTIALLALAAILSRMPAEAPLARMLGLFAAAIAGGPIIWSAVKGLARGQTNVNELVAMSIIGAVAMGWLIEAGLVALILQIGALIEQVAGESARNAVLALQKLAPVHARIRVGESDEVIEAARLKIGDVLVVQAGERIAADGSILRGETSVDESMVTGESLPVDKTVGAAVLAGTINLTGSAEVKVTRVGEHSALGHTIALVRRAQQFQPRIIRAADKFFSFYTPIVLGASLLVWLITGDPVRMITMWVVGCPCAMLLASPLAVVVSMARASRSGIQVKAGPFVEASATVNTILLDKTGTITTGKFVVSGIKPAAGITENELLRIAASVEYRSTHPLARAIVSHAKARGITPNEPADVRLLDGLGVEALIDNQLTRAGSLKLMPSSLAAAAGALDTANEDLPIVAVFLARGDQLLGVVQLTDEIRPEAARAISRLRMLGIKHVAMMTGDRRRTAELVGRAVGCDEVYAELLPSQKVDLVRKLQRANHGVAMVGDGVNDAPSLAAATVGIAMGLRGTDAAIEAADAVLLKDDLTRVPLLIYLARQTRWAIYQNLVFAKLLSIVAEVAAAFGLFGPVVAAMVHLAAVLVIAINSVRLAGSSGAERPSSVKPIPPAPADTAVTDFPLGAPALQMA